MSNPAERLNYVQDSSSDTETDKETGGRGRHRIYKNRMRYYVNDISIILQVQYLLQNKINMIDTLDILDILYY